MVRAGYMANPEHGTWQITTKGRQWLAEHPNESNIDLGGSDEERTPRRRREPGTKQASELPVSGPSLAMLERTRQIMGDEQFRPLWGTLYDQLVAAERARAISDISDAELAHNAQQHVRRIQKYLQGYSDERPQAEQLCDLGSFLLPAGAVSRGGCALCVGKWRRC